MTLEKVMELNYIEYVVYLKAKYGKVKENYVIKNKNSYKYNKNNSRVDEGLMIHHVLEDQYVYLSNASYNDFNALCINHPETQSANNLVYCNYIEHLILHIKIMESQTMEHRVCGWGGIFSIMKHINSAYKCYYIEADTNYDKIDSFGSFRKSCTKVIIQKLYDYLYLVDYIMNNIMTKIIQYSDGTVGLSSLYSTYDGEFDLVKIRIKANSKYTEITSLINTTRRNSQYQSLNDLYRAYR